MVKRMGEESENNDCELMVTIGFGRANAQCPPLPRYRGEKSKGSSGTEKQRCRRRRRRRLRDIAAAAYRQPAGWLAGHAEPTSFLPQSRCHIGAAIVPINEHADMPGPQCVQLACGARALLFGKFRGPPQWPPEPDPRVTAAAKCDFLHKA